MKELIISIALTSAIFTLIFVGYIKCRESFTCGDVSYTEKLIIVVCLIVSAITFIISTIASIWVN